MNNLHLALYYIRLNAKDKRALILSELKKVGLDHLHQRKVYELSGREQQRIALVRAIIKPHRLILADEPTGSLDQDNKLGMLAKLEALNRAGKTLVIVTHDPEVAQRCHKVYRIYDHHVVLQSKAG